MRKSVPKYFEVGSGQWFSTVFDHSPLRKKGNWPIDIEHISMELTHLTYINPVPVSCKFVSQQCHLTGESFKFFLFWSACLIQHWHRVLPAATDTVWIMLDETSASKLKTPSNEVCCFCCFRSQMKLLRNEFATFPVTLEKKNSSLENWEIIFATRWTKPDSRLVKTALSC